MQREKNPVGGEGEPENTIKDGIKSPEHDLIIVAVQQSILVF